MKRRYLISALLFTACVGVALAVTAMLPPTPGVTKANLDRIEIGMTVDEVNAILGPPEWHGETNNPNLCICWVGNDGRGSVYFDTSGRISSKTWDEREQSILERISRWVWPEEMRPPKGLRDF